MCPADPDSLFIIAPQAGITYSWSLSGDPAVINTGNYYLAKNITKTAAYLVTASSNPAVCTSKSTNARITVRTKLPTPVIHTDSIGLAILIFRWEVVPGATGYLVSLDRGNTYVNPAGGPLGLTQIITGLLPNQTMSIAVKATGPYSCQTSDSVQSKATTLNPFGDGIYAPNAFTPNGDGVNDAFLVYGTAIGSIKLMIYNQWGTQLFISTDISKGWDGIYKGQKAPAGTYIYALEAIMQDGKMITKSGSFNLIS
jgi:gliding motility-associated-like protein